MVGCIVFGRGGVPGGWCAAGVLQHLQRAVATVGPSRKERSPLAQAKGAQRDAWQVLANGGFATLCIMLGPPARRRRLSRRAVRGWRRHLGDGARHAGSAGPAPDHHLAASGPRHVWWRHARRAAGQFWRGAERSAWPGRCSAAAGAGFRWPSSRGCAGRWSIRCWAQRFRRCTDVRRAAR